MTQIEKPKADYFKYTHINDLGRRVLNDDIPESVRDEMTQFLEDLYAMQDAPPIDFIEVTDEPDGDS